MTIKGTNGYWNVKAEVYEKANSVNINNNTSVVRMDIYVGRNAGTGNSYIWGSFTGTCTVNGSSQSFSGSTGGQVTINAGSYWYAKVTKDFTVTHNADGSKSVSVSFSWSADFSPKSASASGTLKLTTIARKTACPSLTGFIKSSYNLTLSPRSNSFTHSLKIVFGGLTRWLQANGTLGTSEYKFSTRSPLITIPAEFYTQFSGYEGVGTFYLYTYNGNTNLGSNTGSLRAQCNPAYKPTITSYSITDINETTLDITKDENDIIQNASTAKIILSFSNGDVDDPIANITSRTINGTSFTGNTITMIEPSSNSFTINLINNRNATNTITISSSGVLLPYIKPTLNITSLKRPEPTGDDVNVDYNGNFYTGRFVGSHNVSPDLVVGDDIPLSDLRFNFPNNLYESIEETEHTTDIIVTDTYKIVEEFYFDSLSSKSGCYSNIVLVSTENNQNTTQFQIYSAYGTLNGDSYTYEVGINYTQLPSHITDDFGVITNVYNNIIPYQYMSKYVSEEAAKNTLTISWKYKEKDTETWNTGGTLNPTINTQENIYNGNETIGDLFDYRKQYDFEFTLTDKINTVTVSMSISRGLPIIWWTGDAVHILGDVYVSGTVHTNE